MSSVTRRRGFNRTNSASRSTKTLRLHMATFHPNPNDASEPWIERSAIDGLGFRIWHVMFFCFAGFLAVVTLICCCVKIRVPRTKQEIEADYLRKKLAAKFKQRLMLIKNQEMDAIDLKRALEIIQEDYQSETKNIEEKVSMSAHPDYNVEAENVTRNLKPEAQRANKSLGAEKSP